MTDEKSVAHKKASGEALSLINSIIDEKSFVETQNYLSFGKNVNDISASAVSGYATVNSRPVCIAAQNSAIFQGGFTKAAGKKFKDAVNLSRNLKVPFISIIDSFGADVSEGIDIMNAYAEMLCATAGIESPHICVVKGYALGNMALFAGLADVVVFTESGISSYNSPSVVLASEGKTIDTKVFGAKAHAEKSGLATIVCDVKNLGATVRKIIDYLPLNTDTEVPAAEADLAMYNSLVPGIESMSVINLIGALTDKDSFVEFNKGFCDNIITGLARICGETVGIIAASGDLDEKGAYRAVRLLDLTNRFSIPTLHLVDCEGVKISSALELSQFGHNLSRLIKMSNIDAPRIAVITGSAIGLAYTAFAATALNCDAVYAWNTAKIAPLNSKAGGLVMYGDKVKNSKDIFASRKEVEEMYDRIDANPYKSAEAGIISNVIAPEETRQYIASSMQLLLLKNFRD